MEQWGSAVRVKGLSGRWSERSRLVKVDLYTRGTIYLVIWSAVSVVAALLVLQSATGTLSPLPALAAVALTLAHGLVCARLARRAMDTYLGQDEVPRGLLGWATALTCAESFVALLLVRSGTPEALEALPGLLSCVVLPLSAGYALLVRNRVTALAHLGVLAAVFALTSLTGMGLGQRIFTAVFVTFASAWLAWTGRASLWVLAVMWELREARDVQARLAVAEERLRFGRDLHDVLGRNLAVVALKSELAVQLARRGRPEAVDQMLEVQQIAQDSQREVREVVRGYREADLRAELEGARSVLEAAGITCTVVLGRLELPGEVESTLGWVVREAATNVLRHGDPRRCTISVGEVDGTALLVVENDGAGPHPAPAASATPAASAASAPERPGTGLAGLRERLSAVGGELETDSGRTGRFRLLARIPLDPTGTGTGGGIGRERAADGGGNTTIGGGTG
ncbi:sensor histidine kinase [Streptomyces clavuligerus]|uniref:Two-component system sensor kinase n=1 Tax=Streptomyces clavuligerus TaxID=1901 RepID=E2PXS5_STRCL|nr:histidine kinase [Streptomyces clavuligerus]EFG08165.1 two-component system sensor kinase [Streptomyces clavuligerus]MBY6303651.1 two-component sensor histidine kinase [Streptomyces clavuligerus]QCS06465.1 two-component sensor histidine kinase [Streptomyces clavuligerus]QPJ94180.1 two-component sensor histidine kinase [Streptomyces clavuligerus]